MTTMKMRTKMKTRMKITIIRAASLTRKSPTKTSYLS
jgi:hypothetical protein